MIKGFKDFLLRGNVIDLAVAVVIGSAFAALVGAFTDNIIRPVLAALGSREYGRGLGFPIRGGELKDATFIDLGAVITAAITFLITAAVVYFVFVAPVNRLMELRRRGIEPEAKSTPEDIALLQEIRDLLRERNVRE